KPALLGSGDPDADGSQRADAAALDSEAAALAATRARARRVLHGEPAPARARDSAPAREPPAAPRDSLAPRRVERRAAPSAASAALAKALSRSTAAPAAAPQVPGRSVGVRHPGRGADPHGARRRPGAAPARRRHLLALRTDIVGVSFERCAPAGVARCLH